MHQVPTSGEAGSSTGTSASPDSGPPPPEPTHAERCRTLVAGANRGSLSTLAADPEGYPYGSVASYALDDAGNPLFFVSLMAEHTQNALRDPRASLLVTEPVPEGTDPLASGRATLLGRAPRGVRRRPLVGARALPRGQPDLGVLHRLRRLRLLPARRAEHPLRRRLRPHELGRPRRVRRGRARSAGLGRGRDHRAHERRPRRRAGPVLPPPRRAGPTPRRPRCRPSTGTASR